MVRTPVRTSAGLGQPGANIPPLRLGGGDNLIEVPELVLQSADLFCV